MPASGRIEELRKRYDENQRRFFAPLANEYRKAGDLDQAISLCRMHLAEAPANLNGQIVFGQALYDAGTLDEARGAFEAAIALDPENLIALRHLGDIAREQGDIPNARQWYRRVLDADRRNEEVLAIMDELTALEAAGGPVAAMDISAGADQGGIDTIEIEEPQMRAPAPARPSIMSLIGAPPPEARDVPTVEVQAIPAQEAIEIESTSLVAEAPQAPQAPPEPEAPEADAIDFGMVETESAPPEPAIPESSFGLDVDLGAATEIPVATSVGDTGSFGVVDLPDDKTFGGTADIKPEGIETASDSMEGNIELHEPFELESFDAPAAEVIEIDEPASPPKLELVKDDTAVDELDLIDEHHEIELDEPPAPPHKAETMSRRSTPVVFNFDLSVDDPARPRTPVESVSAHAAPESDLDSDLLDAPDVEAPVEAVSEEREIDIREMPTPVIQPAVETFVTETMAELYVNQGLRNEAIGVYKQLIEARPHDESLRARLAELENDGRIPEGATAREFFSVISRRSAKARLSGAGTLPEAATPRGSLDRLFGGASVARHDEHAAQSLSAAFGTDSSHEESALDRVFNTGPARPPGR